MTRTLLVVRQMDRQTQRHRDAEMREKPATPFPSLSLAGSVVEGTAPPQPRVRVRVQGSCASSGCPFSASVVFLGLSGVDSLHWGRTCQQIASLLPRCPRTMTCRMPAAGDEWAPFLLFSESAYGSLSTSYHSKSSFLRI